MSGAFADPSILLVEPSAMQAKVVSKAFRELGMEKLRTALGVGAQGGSS